MRLLILAVLVLVVLAIYFIVRAIIERDRRKFRPVAKQLESGETQVGIINGRGNAYVGVDTIAADLPEYELEAEYDIAWDRAVRMAKSMNKGEGLGG